MKKLSYIVAPAVIAGAVILGSTLTLKSEAGPAATPGAADDPIVTKSYVDQQISAISGGAGAGGGTGTGGAGAGLGVTIVQLQPGFTIMAKSGTEIIVRSDAKVVAVSTDTNTIPDLTAGTEIKANSLVPKNHLLLFPNTTRGVKASAWNTDVSWLMVRGGYTITDKNGALVEQK